MSAIYVIVKYSFKYSKSDLYSKFIELLNNDLHVLFHVIIKLIYYMFYFVKYKQDYKMCEMKCNVLKYFVRTLLHACFKIIKS